MTPKLFSPLRLHGLTLRNRIVLSPMLTYAAHNGFPSDWHLVHLGKYATAGVGLVFMESTKVDPRGCSTPNDLGLWKDAFIAPLRRITEYIKSQGAAAGIQIAHSGRKARTSVPWAGRAPLPDHWPGVDHGEPWELIGPSAIAHGPGYSRPRPMTIADIEDQIEAWGQAAERADKAGFDVLELHGAHGYLIHQFLSGKSNQRTDAYGGSLENRMRFALQVATRVRHSWPQDKPLFFRTSAVDHEGWTLQDTIRLSIELGKCGVDVIDCSSGGIS
ncbi:MAG: NADH:flavin oxidoreductase/NADH oxidase, partial [Burkholderiaceae bacterium]